MALVSSYEKDALFNKSSSILSMGLSVLNIILFRIYISNAV